jgi:hypothetical protein
MEWLPFPQAAPRWVIEKGLGTEEDRVEFFANSQTARLRALTILKRFPISREIEVAAEITLGGSSPYVDFYFSVPMEAAEEFRCVSTSMCFNLGEPEPIVPISSRTLPFGAFGVFA